MAPAIEFHRLLHIIVENLIAEAIYLDIRGENICRLRSREVLSIEAKAGI